MPVTEQVWIVDDDSSIRWVMEKALSRAGLSCRAFENGNDVMDALAQEEPMVVVSDIRMPGMDGIVLLSQIKAQQPDLPVIIFSGHGNIDTAVSAVSRGAMDFIEKPFSDQLLLDRVRQALQRDERAAQADEVKSKIKDRLDSLTPREHFADGGNDENEKRENGTSPVSPLGLVGKPKHMSAYYCSDDEADEASMT